MIRWLFIRRSLAPVALFAIAGVGSMELSRIDGGFAMVWIANGLLVPWLLARPPRQWWLTLAAVAAVAGLACATIGLGWRAAPLLALASCVEAGVAALLIRKAYRHFRTYTSVSSVLAIYAAGGLVAPALSGIPAAVGMSLAGGSQFLAAFAQWSSAHALGFVAVFPCVGLLMQARARRRQLFPPGRRKSAALSLAAVLVAGLVCFGQSRVPLLFLPVLVTMYTMVLSDLFVSALGLALLLAMGIASAFLGVGPLQLLSDTPEQRFVFLQLYAACVSLAAMPIAVMLEHRRKGFAALAYNEARFRLLADFSTDIIMITGVDGIIHYVSPSIRQLGEWDPARLVGKTTDVLIAPQHRGDVADAHMAALAEPGTTATVEFLGMTRNSGMRWFESHLRAIVREDGNIEGICSIARDTSGRKRREAELRTVALTDPLTNLANRRAFEMFMGDAHEAATESYVALFDLDHFKLVNDTYGHDAGDRVIQAFARAARSAVRETDLVARLGGEEFAVHLHDTTLRRARIVCERISAALAHEVRRTAPEVGKVTTSVGLSRLDGPLTDVLRRADAALYGAKAAGRDRLNVAA